MKTLHFRSWVKRRFHSYLISSLKGWFFSISIIYFQAYGNLSKLSKTRKVWYRRDIIRFRYLTINLIIMWLDTWHFQKISSIILYKLYNIFNEIRILLNHTLNLYRTSNNNVWINAIGSFALTTMKSR